MIANVVSNIELNRHMSGCFFTQNAAYEMRISDWSSDVCSSDLDGSLASGDGGRRTASLRQDPLRIEVGHSEIGTMERGLFSCGDRSHAGPHPADRDEREQPQIVDSRERKSTRLNSSH